MRSHLALVALSVVGCGGGASKFTPMFHRRPRRPSSSCQSGMPRSSSQSGPRRRPPSPCKRLRLRPLRASRSSPWYPTRRCRWFKCTTTSLTGDRRPCIPALPRRSGSGTTTAVASGTSGPPRLGDVTASRGAVISDGVITNVNATDHSFADRVHADAKSVNFDFFTQGNEDGFYFRVVGNQCVRFYMTVDSRSEPQLIHIGRADALLRSARVCI